MSQPWKNRIVSYGEESPDSITRHPSNWRLHPQNQQDALSGVLGSVGVVQNIIINRTTGRLVDGHLRVSLALRDGQPTVPVTYVELSESEESLVLSTLDPLGAMAETDSTALDALLREVSTDSPAVIQMWDELIFDVELTEKQENEKSEMKPKINAVIQAGFAVDSLDLVEQAISKTGKQNRGEAIAELARVYLERQ
jgi:hypothetical protein